MSVDGFVDEIEQAFLTIELPQGPLDFQIDTGFSGALIIGSELFETDGATDAGTIDAELAADHHHTFQAYEVVLNWFDEPVLVRVMVGPGKECLIGTQMLTPHRLEIDFATRIARLIRNPSW